MMAGCWLSANEGTGGDDDIPYMIVVCDCDCDGDSDDCRMEWIDGMGFADADADTYANTLYTLPILLSQTCTPMDSKHI